MPSTVELLDRIKRYKSTNLSKLTDAQIVQRVKTICNHCATRRMFFQFSNLYRARINPGPRFGNSNELWYPPAGVAGRGRFNRAGESVFYASSNAAIALYEIGAKPGQVVTVAKLRPKNPLHDIPFSQVAFERCKSDKINSTLQGQRYRECDVWPLTLKRAGLSMRYWCTVDDFIADIVTDPYAADPERRGYAASQYIHDWLIDLPGVSGLCYPTVAGNLKGMNFCLPTQAADGLFELEEACEMLVEGYIDAPNCDRLVDLSPRCLSTSVRPDGSIEWGRDLIGMKPESVAALLDLSAYMALKTDKKSIEAFEAFDGLEWQADYRDGDLMKRIENEGLAAVGYLNRGK